MSTAVQAPKLSELLEQPNVHRNLSPAPLVEAALRRGEGELSARGSLVAETGKRTGRSPKDKFTVKDSITDDKVAWGSANQPFPPEKFDALYERVLDYLQGKELFVQDLFCGADPQYQLPIQRHQRVCLAQPVRAAALHPADGGRAEDPQARVHHRQRARLSWPIPSATAPTRKCLSS